jgi:dTDP-4-dehydrorhamnose reductase
LADQGADLLENRGWDGLSDRVIGYHHDDHRPPIRATLVARAADTRLDCATVMREFGVTPRPWRQALEDTIDRLLSNKGMP